MAWLMSASRENAAGMDLALHRAVAFPSLVYRPRRPEHEVLHSIVRDHDETFRAQASRRADGRWPSMQGS